MIRLILAILLLPAMAGAGQGMGPGPGFKTYGGSSEFCDGTDTFCTSWETGTDALNTGATGNEDVFEASAGTFARVTTSPKDGDNCIYGQQ